MAEVMIQISIKEIRESPVNGVESETTEVIAATIPPRLAAATLRALADEYDPPKPVTRGGSL